MAQAKSLRVFIRHCFQLKMETFSVLAIHLDENSVLVAWKCTFEKGFKAHAFKNNTVIFSV